MLVVLMTNIESLASSAKTVRRRRQDTYSVSGNLQAASLDAYITSRSPEPALGDCQAYTEAEIVPTHNEASGEQVIEFEKSLPTEDLIRTIRSLKEKRKQLLAGSKVALRIKFQELVRKYTEEQWRRSRKLIRVFLSEKFEKKNDGVREVRRLVNIKARQVIRWKIVGFTPNGRPRWATRPVWRTVKVWRTLVVPKYRKVVIRPAGFYLRRSRDTFKVTVINWLKVRAEYTSYKSMRKSILSENLSAIRSQLAKLYKQLSDRPKMMYSNTTQGSTNLLPVTPESVVRGTDYPAEFWLQTYLAPVGLYTFAYNSLASYDEAALNDIMRVMERDHGVPTGHQYIDYAVPIRGQGELRIYPKVEQVYGTEGGSEKLAYSQVLALTKAEDYTFQWFRSLLELKDLRGTIATPARASGVLMALCREGFRPSKVIGKVTVLRGLKGVSILRATVGAYLLWKFGIQPTIQDIDTVTRESVEWLVSLRRSLTALLDRLQDQGNIFHARAKFGANSRILKLGAYLPVEPEHTLLSAACMQTVHLPALVMVQPGTSIDVLEGDPDIEYMSIQSTGDNTRDLVFGGSGTELTVVTETKADVDKVYIDWPSYCQHQKWTGSSWDNSGNELRGEVNINLGRYVAEPDTGFEPTFKMPVYAWNHLSGCIFASYCMGEVAQLSSEYRSLVESLKNLVKRGHEVEASLTSVISDVEKHLDRTFVAWELTPLSFVYDWFTDSHTIVSTLANLARKSGDERIPEPLYGIWESKRCELLTGTVKCQLDKIRVSEYVSKWHKIRITREGSTAYWATPAVINRRYEYGYRNTDDKVHLQRSGLYRVRRGEHLGYPDVFTFAPRLKPNLDLGKLTTLSALLAQFTAPKGG